MTAVETERLRLVPYPPVEADEIAPALGVHVPPEWPAEVLDILPAYLDELRRDPALLGWGPWVMIESAERTLVGDLGFTGKPDAGGSVEIGYSVLPEYRRRGYASEAVGALLTWALDQPRVTRVVAATGRDNAASLGVLRRVGMQLVGETGGVLNFESSRPSRP